MVRTNLSMRSMAAKLSCWQLLLTAVNLAALAARADTSNVETLTLSSRCKTSCSVALGGVLAVEYSVGEGAGVVLPPALLQSHQVFAAVNGSLLGAGVDVRATGIVSVPMPLAGAARIELVLQPRFGVGVLYVGVAVNASAVVASAQPLMAIVHFAAVRRPIRGPGTPVIGIEYDLRKGTDPTWGPSGCPGGDAVESVPLVGRYAASNQLVARQHAMWLTRLGIDFVTLDWTGICWGETTPVGKTWNGSFADRPLSVQRLLNDSLALLALQETMRHEGHDAPRIVPIMGLDNGPIAPIACLNEAIAWLATVRDAHPHAFLPSDGAGAAADSTVLIFDGAGKTRPSNYSAHGFAIRMMSSQLQANPSLAEAGYWSWMDGPGGPGIGGPAVTVTPAYFGNCPVHGPGMWIGADAVGRRGGYTFYQQLSVALRTRPKILLVSQWNEFAGQANGGGYGVDKQCFGDSYSRELSNDVEPTSLASTDCYIRPNATCVGWGMYYLNLLHAMLNTSGPQQARGAQDATTLLFITSPTWMANVSTAAKLNVSWAIASIQGDGPLLQSDSDGPEHHPIKQPATELRLQFSLAGQHLTAVAVRLDTNQLEGSTVLDLSRFDPHGALGHVRGEQALIVEADGVGVASGYPLSLTELDTSSGVLRPPRATVWLNLE